MTTKATPPEVSAPPVTMLDVDVRNPGINKMRKTAHSAISGYLAGMSGVLLGHPLDSLKVWIQTQTHGKNKHLQPSNSSSSNSQSRSIIKNVRAYYSGVTGPLLTMGFAQSLNFAIYDAARRFLYEPDPSKKEDVGPYEYRTHDSIGNVALAGFASGAGMAILTAPLILIKTRQQVTGLGFREASLDALLCPTTKTWQPSATMAGIIPHTAASSLGRALYYAVYEYTKREWLAAKLERDRGDKLAIWERCLAAGVAGIACWSFIFPFDAVRNRLYVNNRGGITPYGNSSIPYSLWKDTVDTTRQMWRERTLYGGFSVTIVRAGFVAAVVLPVYDSMLDYLSKNY